MLLLPMVHGLAFTWLHMGHLVILAVSVFKLVVFVISHQPCQFVLQQILLQVMLGALLVEGQGVPLGSLSLGLHLGGVGELGVAPRRHVLRWGYGIVVLGFHFVAVPDGYDDDAVLLRGGKGEGGVRPDMEEEEKQSL